MHPSSTIHHPSSPAPAAPLRRHLHPKTTVPPDADHAPAHTLDFRSSDETLDRYHEVISVGGWKLDNYRKNPVVQNAHSYWSLADTIGKALITEVRSAVDSPLLAILGEGPGVRAPVTHHASRITPPPSATLPQLETRNSEPGTYLFQRIQFAVAENPMAKLAYGLYKGGFLNAVSVGFIPLRWEDVPEESFSSSSSSSSSIRRKYLEQELLEVSAVSIPANPNALALGLKEGAIEKSDLKELVEVLRDVWGEESGRAGERKNGGGRESETRACEWENLKCQMDDIRAILKHA